MDETEIYETLNKHSEIVAKLAKLTNLQSDHIESLTARIDLLEEQMRYLATQAPPPNDL